MRLPVNRTCALIAFGLLSGCAVSSGARAPSQPPVARSGPAADFPIVIGDPFTIDSVTYTPVDRLNYDEVGIAAVGAGDSAAVTAANKTLPLPSYVEVTSLESGRTILVRVTNRGPMRNDQLIELSPGAASQLGILANTAVRVRRVNPPEGERAMLRTGVRAPERMETPKPLLEALKRKLGKVQTSTIAPVAPITAQPAVAAGPVAGKPVVVDAVAVRPEAAVRPAPPPERSNTPTAKAGGSLFVQIAAFSTSERANAEARKFASAFVAHPARYWLLRLGPFSTHAEADAALAKAKAAGYIDARIQRAD